MGVITNLLTEAKILSNQEQSVETDLSDGVESHACQKKKNRPKE